MQHIVPTRTSRRRPLAVLSTALVAGIAAATLVACNRPEPGQTVGQKVDNAIAGTERKAQELSNDVKSAAGEAAAKTEQMAAGAANSVKDAAITTAVNAELAQDSKLSAMRIDVDTVNGRVVLRGNAPDSSASERAQQLAASVEGVVSVDNQLVVGGKG